MLRLTLNGKEAAIQKNTSFRINEENQVFSENGSYSMQIILPIRGCKENTKIFGNINRIEVDLNKLQGDFVLETEILSIKGDFKIIGINDFEVKIQLLANKTLASFRTKDIKKNRQFIDEIPLGDFLDECDLAQEIYDMGIPEIAPDFEVHPRNLQDMIYYLHYAGKWRTHSIPPATTCVTFPIVSTAEGNENVVNEHRGKNGDYDLVADVRIIGNKSYNERIALQPQLLEVMKRVYRYLGFDFESQLDKETEYTFIANSRCTLHYRDILPHWTIQDFVKEVCAFFDAVVIISDDKAVIKKRSDIYSGDIQIVEKVIDEYDVKCEEEDPESHAVGNVDYEWPEEDPQLRVPDEVYERAIVKYLTGEEIIKELSEMDEEEQSLSRNVYINKEDGLKYALLQRDTDEMFELRRLDWYEPLIRNTEKREINTAIKIVPVRMKRFNMNFFIGLPVMAVDDVIQPDKVYSVNNAIKPDSENAEKNQEKGKRDVIEVFFHDGGVSVKSEARDNTYPSPLGVMLEKNKDGFLEIIPSFGESREDRVGPFQLKKRGTEYSQIDGKKEYVIKFLSEKPLDINRPFLIGNRKFICKKMEYKCNVDGISKIVNGTFYLLK